MLAVIAGPTTGEVSELKNGGSSQQAAMTWPGFAKADSHALARPPEDSPLTNAGLPITPSRNRTRSLPTLSRV